MNRDLIHVFMAVLEPIRAPARSFLSLHSTDNRLFVGEQEKCQIKCLHVVFPVDRNPSAAPQGASKVSRDASHRIQNLNFLVQQIKSYYLVSFDSQPYYTLYGASELRAAKLSISLYIGLWYLNIRFRLFTSSITHALAHTCAKPESRWHSCPSRSTSPS